MKHIQHFEGVLDTLNDQVYGISVWIYTPSHGDFSAGGITSKHKDLYLIGEEIPTKFEVPLGDIYLKIKKYNDYIYAVPIGELNRAEHAYKFGGNFIYSSDGAFPFQHPIPVHDRYES